MTEYHPEYLAKKKLEQAMTEYVKEVGGPTSVMTDYVFTIASADMSHETGVTQYWEGYRGPMHSLMGLNVMQRQLILAMNAEEIDHLDHEGDDDDDHLGA